VFAAVFAVTWATLEYFGLISIGDWPEGWRARGPFKDPNVYGPFLVPVAVFAVSRMATGGKHGATFYLPLFVLISFGLLISFSRGAWLNYFGSLALFGTLLFLSDRGAASRVRIMLVGLVLLCCAATMVVAAVSNERVAGLFFQRTAIVQKYDIAEGGRFAAQQRAIQTAAARPWGIGPGRSDEEFGLEPHNLYLHVLVEGGWLSGIGFYGLILFSFYRARPLFGQHFPFRIEAFVAVSSLVGILSQSFFIDSTHWRHLWLLMAMLWGLVAISRNFSSKI
jgi:O-antigen ligase